MFVEKVRCQDCGWKGLETQLEKNNTDNSEYCPNCGSFDIINEENIIDPNAYDYLW
jgi:predicted RNA-binding Zn-ribbon protein involved in translation (DUF1610 family)